MKIQFKIYPNGKIQKIQVSENYGTWGGINSGFISSDGSIGNICEEKDFEKYKNALINREIKDIDKEIKLLEKKKNRYLKLL